MSKKQFTISKLNNLKNNLSSIVTWMNNMIEVNSNFPKEFETKDIMIPYLKNYKKPIVLKSLVDLEIELFHQ